jgi:2-polyprenyl-3-methyl-5-hydroxy-6-metoxy-1,4-benzoquinol methylase
LVRDFLYHAGHGIQSQKKEMLEACFLEGFSGKSLKILDVVRDRIVKLTFAEMGHEVSGIDISGQMLKIAKQKPSLRS